MADVSNALANVKARFGDDGLRAVAAFMFAMGTDTCLTFADEAYTPCDFVMQECWELGGDPLPTPAQEGIDPLICSPVIR